MILRSPTKHENRHHRHAGMDGRHPGPQDASGDIHVAWIPALHAGMTNEGLKLTIPLCAFFKGGFAVSFSAMRRSLCREEENDL
jgi:hypothetical protein